jgi:hypothetical protein
MPWLSKSFLLACSVLWGCVEKDAEVKQENRKKLIALSYFNILFVLNAMAF